MSSPYTPDATNIAADPLVTDVTVPDDGDFEDVASILVAIEYAIDWLAWLTTGRSSSLDIDYAQAFRPIYVSGEFTMLTSPPVLQQDSTAGEVIFELELPNQATLHSVRIYLKGAGGHGTLADVTKPTATVTRLNLLSGAQTTIGGPTTDPSVLATYEAYHDDLEVDCSDHEIARGQPHIPTASTTKNRYYVTITGEDGAGFEAGLKIYGVSCDFTMETTRDPGAA